MVLLRSLLSVSLSMLLAAHPIPCALAASPALGILTVAHDAHLEEAAAYPGLSVFEGERLWTEEEGRLGLRAGHSTLAFGAKTDATLFNSGDGMHVDLGAGSLFFSAAESERIEIHVQEAIFLPESNQPTQAMVTTLAPKVLQITTQKGGLNFSYRQEFRNLPPGETYRIYLDAPAEPQDAAGAGAQSAGKAGKVAYFIVGAGAGALAAWGIHQVVASGNGPESPAKP